MSDKERNVGEEIRVDYRNCARRDQDLWQMGTSVSPLCKRRFPRWVVGGQIPPPLKPGNEDLNRRNHQAMPRLARATSSYEGYTRRFWAYHVALTADAISSEPHFKINLTAILIEA